MGSAKLAALVDGVALAVALDEVVAVKEAVARKRATQSVAARGCAQAVRRIEPNAARRQVGAIDAGQRPATARRTIAATSVADVTDRSVRVGDRHDDGPVRLGAPGAVEARVAGPRGRREAGSCAVTARRAV